MTREDCNNAIKVLKNYDLNNSKVNSLLFSAEEITNAFDIAIKALEQQSEDAISREDAIKRVSQCLKGVFVEYEDIARKMFAEDKLPSAQPKYNTSEWCHDCKEYDNNKHCCPRFNNVIRKAVEEIKQSKMGQWIPVSERLPKESVPVLVQAEEIYYADSYTKGIIIGWRGKMGWHTITNKGREIIHYPITWMPLPEPYEPQESEKTDADSD